MKVIEPSSRIRFTVVQLSRLERTEIENALGLANQIQNAFDFDFYGRRFPLKPSEYRFPNSGWDLDRAVHAILKKKHHLPRPLLFLTSLPYSVTENRNKDRWFYFSEYGLDNDLSVSIVSTYLWKSLPGCRPLQPYVLLSLAAVALSFCAGLQMHEETRGCPFDYCDKPENIDFCFSSMQLCPECERHLNKSLRAGHLSVGQLAASKKLLNRARDRRLAFVAMPFRKCLNSVYRAVRGALKRNGWDVLRADEIAHPRRVTDAVVGAILTSELVVADITGQNPNVFFELGLAYAAGIDIVIITQGRSIPFDVQAERAVFYRLSHPGLSRLALEIEHFAK